MPSLPPAEEFRAFLKRINSNNYLLNKQLQHICSLHGMRSNGVKAELQRRLIEAITKAFTQGDATTYREIEQSVIREKAGLGSGTRGYAASTTPTPATTQQQVRNAHAPIGQPSSMGGNISGVQQNGQQNYGSYSGTNGLLPVPPSPTSASFGLSFKHSPFYRVVDRVGNIHVCEPMEHHRFSINVGIQAQENPLLQQCTRDKSLRVMVFCATSNVDAQNISFPHQSELKVNGEDVKANLRGLKNKPGSTRPVDITDLLRLKIAAYRNSLEFTYALTKTRFYLAIFVCKVVANEHLLQAISTRKISKDSVIRELTRKANDADIELSSQVLSLKCPLSYMRLVTPVRATTCTHVQCFDADSYLQLQQQGPQWMCPVCSKPAPYERLAVDEYVRDILDSTSKGVEQVDIEPNGHWSVHGPVEAEAEQSENQHDTFELDDDEVSISDVHALRKQDSETPTTLAPRTPVSGVSREPSSMPRSGGTKRAHEVIDLTLSDDDDDEPPQPAHKRRQLARPDGEPTPPS
ncbi:PINIT domain-domain-containing protein [Coniella lustricola]|uniref:PINIT domain-domain-containing protein n=1 Tax=Coniella lustricola TaxID=2025994 RepID=A0A2T3AEL6_9PEZI|nr:PINIT domain-domain-containing protein [Coniella lustricola]